MRLKLDERPVVVGGGAHARPAHLVREHVVDFAPEADQAAPWFAAKAWGVFLVMLYPLLAAAPLLILAALNRVSDHLRTAEVGVDCALVGLTILALQFAITARLSWVEAPFGLDVLLVFHRAMALVATALLCVHPLLVAREEGWSLLAGLHVHWYIWVGRLALALLLLQVIVSLSRRIIRLPYDQWRRLHNPIALAILALGFAHSLAAGDDMHGAALFVWCTVMAAAYGFWLYRRVVRPRLLLRNPFRVIGVKSEAPHVWTLTLEPRGERSFHFAPGQFQFLRLHGAGVPSEEHPFTIASSPARSGRISLTIKESGTFTSGIGRVRPGDRATVHGPFGRFSHTLHPDEGDLVFVAGGVGITPLMSMLRYMRDRSESRRVLLAYASRGPADMLFTNELEAMQAGSYPVLRVVHVLADAPSSWVGETGKLDADRLLRLCGGAEGKAFYLCCPPPMTAALIRGLRRMGVSPRRIHTDYFSL
ncbi:MAG TPA: ferredoxin reductase family protein [Candidatus Eisenbacteria bacterium]|jgi:predicted ferric reductase